MKSKRILLAPVGSHVAQAVSNSVVTLTPAVAAPGAKGILVQAIDADIRFTLDGTAPVGGATGFLLYDAHDPLVIDIGEGVTTLKFIRDASTDAELQYQYVRNVG